MIRRFNNGEIGNVSGGMIEVIHDEREPEDYEISIRGKESMLLYEEYLKEFYPEFSAPDLNENIYTDGHARASIVQLEEAKKFINFCRSRGVEVKIREGKRLY